MRNKFLLIFSMMLFFGAKMSAQDTFTQITTLDELTSGEYLIVGDGTSDGLMINEQNASGHATYIKYTSISNPVSTITTGYTDANIFEITVTESQITIFNESVGYVTYRGTGSHASFFNGEVTNQERWTATVNGEGLWFLNNVAAPTRILQWNNSAPRFAAYTTNQVKLKLYKKVETEEPTSYTIEVTQTEGGSVSPEGTIEVEEGGSATFTATPSSICYSFSHWIVNGEEAGNENPYTFSNVTENQTISAVFTMVPDFSITAIAGENGIISPSGEIFAACGSEATFIITPNAGFEIADVLVNGVSVGAVSTYTVEEVMADYTIEATFSAIPVEGACFEEGFDNLTEIATGTQYAAGTYTNNGVTWNFFAQSPIGANGNDYSIEGQGILLRRASDGFLEATIPAGVQTFSFEYRKAYTSGTARQLELIVNGIQVAITPEFGAGSGDQTTVYTFSHELNTTAETIVRIKLTGTADTNRHTTIDNISWTCEEVVPCETPAPTAEAQEFCAGATVADLVAEGTDIKWYATLDSTEALATTEILVAGSYFATQTIDNCESEKTEVVVTLLETPEAPIAESPQIFTEGQTLADLVVEGENLTWYDADGNELPETTVLVDGTTYFVTASNEVCESAQTEILVQLEGETGDACFEEGFDNLTEIATGTQYGAGTYTNNEITWNFHGQSPIGAGGDAADYSIEGQGILLRRASDSFLETTVPASVGTFSFEYRKAYTGGSERQLEFMVNGTQVAVTPAFGAGSGVDETVYTFSFTLNTTAATLVRIKLTGEETTNRHATIDNISWTCLEENPCDIPAPIAVSPQQFTQGQTLADLVVEGENLTWYDEDGNVLEATTVLVDGATYFVTQTIDGCESEPTSIEVYIETLDNGSINFSKFTYYPNPVSNKLTILNTNEISQVEIFNLAGALVLKNNSSSKSVEVNVSQLTTGTYIVKVVSGNEVKTFKMIKK